MDNKISFERTFGKRIKPVLTGMTLAGAVALIIGICEFYAFLAQWVLPFI